MLEINNLSLDFKRYYGLFRQKNINCLNNISLKVGEGEILALIGHSGAGKSLLAHAILGLLPDNIEMSGNIVYKNQTLNENLLKKLRGKEIAFLPQQITYLDPTALIGSQISWAARRADAEPDVINRLRSVGLDSTVANLYPHQLSGGMARRVLMAQATVGGPKLLVTDEPTAGLDPHNRDIVLGQLRKLADNGCAVILITHDLIPALEVADSVALIHDGEIACLADPDDFCGEGEALPSTYAQELWKALPQNEFTTKGDFLYA